MAHGNARAYLGHPRPADDLLSSQSAACDRLRLPFVSALLRRAVFLAVEPHKLAKAAKVIVKLRPHRLSCRPRTERRLRGKKSSPPATCVLYTSACSPAL